MTVLVVIAIVAWFVGSLVLLVLILMAKSQERQQYQALLNERGECYGCYMLEELSKCTNPECRHFVKYSPPTPEEIANYVAILSEREYARSIHDSLDSVPLPFRHDADD